MYSRGDLVFTHGSFSPNYEPSYGRDTKFHRSGGEKTVAWPCGVVVVRWRKWRDKLQITNSMRRCVVPRRECLLL